MRVIREGCSVMGGTLKKRQANEEQAGCIDKYDCLQNIRGDCLQFYMAFHLCLPSVYTGPMLRTGTALKRVVSKGMSLYENIFNLNRFV